MPPISGRFSTGNGRAGGGGGTGDGVGIGAGDGDGTGTGGGVGGAVGVNVGLGVAVGEGCGVGAGVGVDVGVGVGEGAGVGEGEGAGALVAMMAKFVKWLTCAETLLVVKSTWLSGAICQVEPSQKASLRSVAAKPWGTSTVSNLRDTVIGGLKVAPLGPRSHAISTAPFAGAGGASLMRSVAEILLRGWPLAFNIVVPCGNVTLALPKAELRVDVCWTTPEVSIFSATAGGLNPLVVTALITPVGVGVVGGGAPPPPVTPPPLLLLAAT